MLPYFPTTDSVICLIGYATIIFISPRTIHFIISLLLRSSRRIDLRATKNSYAIVTGSSDGIGLEYARQLAKRGFNLLLISRTESKLRKLQEELREKYSIDVSFLYLILSSNNVLIIFYSRYEFLPLTSQKSISTTRSLPKLLPFHLK